MIVDFGARGASAISCGKLSLQLYDLPLVCFTCERGFQLESIMLLFERSLGSFRSERLLSFVRLSLLLALSLELNDISPVRLCLQLCFKLELSDMPLVGLSILLALSLQSRYPLLLLLRIHAEALANISKNRILLALALLSGLVSNALLRILDFSVCPATRICALEVARDARHGFRIILGQ